MNNADSIQVKSAGPERSRPRIIHYMTLRIISGIKRLNASNHIPDPYHHYMIQSISALSLMSLRSNGVPYNALYFPARLFSFVASRVSKVPIWVVVCVSETDGNLTNLTPSELTSTNPSSRNELLRPFSKTAKSNPGPLIITGADQSE